MSEILDSGNRRQFNSGAVRDIAQGKGRMDLVPLDVVSDFYKYTADDHYLKPDDSFDISLAFDELYTFMNTGDVICIYETLWSFISTYYKSIESAILDVSIHYEQGAEKYEERNWEKGIPCHCYVDSGCRHLLKFINGDKDEPHDRAFVWNLLGLLWTVKHKSKFNDLPYNKDRNPTGLNREQFCQYIIHNMNEGRNRN